MDSVVSIELKYDGETTVIDKSSVYMFTSMDMCLSNMTLPESKLVALKYPIGNIIKNYESRGTIAEEYGALGILSDNSANNLSSVSMTEAQKEQIQNDYRSKYGLLKGQRKLLITTASLTYQQMGMSIAEMQLLEMLTSDVMAVADAFNYPSVLLASEKGTTYSNQEGAKRSFYQDTIVPEALHYEEQLNDFLQTESEGVKICYDYEWLPILQMDSKLRAQVRREMGLAVIYEFMNGVITWNEMKLALGQDTKDGMDLYVYELPEEYRKIFEQSIENGKQSNPANGQGYQGDTNGENAGVEGATNANT
jgi:HK97 family phage portal protein